jgi:hypothetical protein
MLKNRVREDGVEARVRERQRIDRGHLEAHVWKLLPLRGDPRHRNLRRLDVDPDHLTLRPDRFRKAEGDRTRPAANSSSHIPGSTNGKKNDARSRAVRLAIMPTASSAQPGA